MPSRARTLSPRETGHCCMHPYTHTHMNLYTHTNIRMLDPYKIPRFQNNFGSQMLYTHAYTHRFLVATLCCLVWYVCMCVRMHVHASHAQKPRTYACIYTPSPRGRALLPSAVLTPRCALEDLRRISLHLRMRACVCAHAGMRGV